MRLSLAITALVAISALIILAVAPRHVEIYRDEKVTAGEVRRPVYSFSPHVSKPQYLKIHGKTYEGLRGSPPFYIEVPILDSILFVTERPKGKVTVHIVNTKTGQDTAVDIDGSGFGWAIGSGRKPGEKGSDYVESASPNALTVATRSSDWKETLILNLASKRVERQETFSYDPNGQVTNHTIRGSPATGKGS